MVARSPVSGRDKAASLAGRQQYHTAAPAFPKDAGSYEPPSYQYSHRSHNTQSRPGIYIPRNLRNWILKRGFLLYPHPFVASFLDLIPSAETISVWNICRGTSVVPLVVVDSVIQSYDCFKSRRISLARDLSSLWDLPRGSSCVLVATTLQLCRTQGISQRNG